MNDIKVLKHEKNLDDYCKIIFKVQTLEVYKNMKHILDA